jgi:hypothetical protein
LFASLPRLLVALSAVCALAACSTTRPASPTQEAANYVAHAKRSYAAPGPANDPWGPYIVEAAAKYDVPEKWVREVMRQESGGRLYENGTLITSHAGAMGLMQVMPGTYDELRARYALGDDPFDPHDNIMAGTAYLRELYDVYGNPGFLAAYNAGPGRLEDYLIRRRGLPDETRRYVARVGPAIADARPQRLASSAQYAQLPFNIPAGPRNPRNQPTQAPVALADNRSISRTTATRITVQSADLPVPPAAPVVVATNAAPTAPPAPRGGFHLISPAMADTMPLPQGGPRTGTWAIQVGAFANETQARTATETAKRNAADQLAQARPAIGQVKQSNATLYRARLTGLSRESAASACERLAKSRTNCIILSPDAQS